MMKIQTLNLKRINQFEAKLYIIKIFNNSPSKETVMQSKKKSPMTLAITKMSPLNRFVFIQSHSAGH